MSEERKTAHTALIEALEHVEDMEDVLILWTTKDNKVKGTHNDASVADTLFLIEVFKFVMLGIGINGQ